MSKWSFEAILKIIATVVNIVSTCLDALGITSDSDEDTKDPINA